MAVLDVQYNIQIEGLGSRKSDYEDKELRQTTLAHIHTNYPEKDWLHVYTDGSATPGEGKAGAGIFCREFEDSFPAGRNGSSYDGEITAIKKALEKVKETKYKKVAILSDSKAAIQAIACKEEIAVDVRNCKLQLLRRLNEGKEVMLQWVPSHCNLYGNEKADYLAKRGSGMVLQQDIETSYRSIKSNIKTAMKSEVRDEWKRKSEGKKWSKYCEGRNMKGNRMTRRTEVAQFRLDTGHDLLGEHLHRLKIVGSENCMLCEKGVHNRDHLFRCESLVNVIASLSPDMKFVDKETCLYWSIRSMMT